MNIAMVNGYVLWKASNPGKRLKRNKYIKSIGIQLVKEFVKGRNMESSNFSADLKKRIDFFFKEMHDQELDQNVPTDGAQINDRKRGRCYLCDRKKDLKCTKKCSKCLLFICKDHTAKAVTCTRC